MNRLSLLFTCAALTLSGCATVETKTSMVTPVGNSVREAGPGDVVMSFESRRSLPNIVGKADIWGRTTSAGGTTVRFIGGRGNQAFFERSDVAVESNATTMTESPMIIPQTTTTTVDGTFGLTSVNGTARSTSYQYIPPRGSTQYSTARQPIRIVVESGRSVTIQGKVLKVLGVSANSVKYTVR